ncbi:MAG TPA: TonB family protein [Candidatus Didemnitutus sp.]|nr:TonB family protein [Candidatus Didemnitutus sp.]
MRAHSPNSFFASLALHGVAVGLIVFATYYSTRNDDKAPVIFELVAGPPTAPDELVAPALGNSANGVKLEVPKVDVPEPVTTPEAQTAPPPDDAIPSKPPPKPVTKPKTNSSLTKDLRKSERMSYQEYLKKHPAPKIAKTTTPSKGGAVPRIDAEGIAEGVKGGSTANKRGGGGGKAMTREEMDAFSTYITFLRRALKEAHEPPPGVSDQLEVKVTFDIAADGTISNPRIARSSGNRDFDESVLAAFRKVHPIGPTPDGRGDTWTVVFKMQDSD